MNVIKRYLQWSEQLDKEAREFAETMKDVSKAYDELDPETQKEARKEFFGDVIGSIKLSFYYLKRDLERDLKYSKLKKQEKMKRKQEQIR